METLELTGMKRCFILSLLLWLAAVGYGQVDSVPMQQSLPSDSLFYRDAAKEVPEYYFDDSVYYYYYDSAYYEDEPVQAPNINPIYYFGSPFSAHFAELKFFAGIGDRGFGIDYAYLPEVWGFHVNGMVGRAGYWVSAGGDLRLSKPWSKADWHCYGSVGVSGGDNPLRPTLEAGVRVAAVEHDGKFCITSGTLGVMTNFQGVFVTVGFGLSICVLASAAVFLAL